MKKNITFNFEHKGHNFPVMKTSEGKFIVDFFADSGLLFCDNAEEIKKEVASIFKINQ